MQAPRAGQLCREAWRIRFPGRAGIPVVNAQGFVNSGTIGVSPGPAAGLYVAGRKPGSGVRGDDLCGFPVQLTAADVHEAYVIMVDQARLSSPVNVLAHELGHNLFLGHGNGFDDDGDGGQTGIPGPRRYDQSCDPDWLAPSLHVEVAEDHVTPFTTCALSSSLMDRHASCPELRPFQVETARGVALVVPGARLTVSEALPVLVGAGAPAL